MRKRYYIIGAREPIGGDRSLRRYKNKSDEYPLLVVERNGVGKSKQREKKCKEKKQS